MTTLFGSRITNCDRCGVRLRIADSNTPDAQLLKLSLTTEGVCANCCMTEVLQITEPINELLRSPRCLSCGGAKYPKAFDKFCVCKPPQFPSIGEVLMQPHIQNCIASLLAVGKSDAKIGDIDWLEVIANWELPLSPRRSKPKGKGRP